jgi:outer membrane protein
MLKYLGCLIFCLFSIVWPITSLATDLVDAYKDAMQNDPTFKNAEALYLATREIVPIKASVLLPQLTSTASVQRAHVVETFGPLTSKFDQTTSQYQISLNQAIFNLAAWQSVALANDQVKQAFANYNAAAQDLMFRVSNAYFAVLQAYDTLLATQAQKNALAQQLRQTEEQFKVGLIAITGVEQVKANYDTTIAQEIANKNAIADKLEELRAITGIFYTHLAGLSSRFPLVSPKPNDINAWVRIAAQQNYTLKAATFNMAAAWENIKVQAAGNFPVVVGNANYSYQYQNPVELDTVFSGKQVVKQAAIGASVNFPIYQGGLIQAETKQASFQYAQAAAQRDQTYRNILTQTRESYLGVMAGISKVKADKQAIISGQSSVDSTRAAYNVGTATIVDVLQQLTILYSAQSSLATDQYAYVISTISLKEAAGTLSGADIVLINSWLGKEINFSPYNFNVIVPAYWSERDTTPPIVNNHIAPNTQTVTPVTKQTKPQTYSKIKSKSTQQAQLHRPKHGSRSQAVKRQHSPTIAKAHKTSKTNPKTVAHKFSPQNKKNSV